MDLFTGYWDRVVEYSFTQNLTAFHYLNPYSQSPPEIALVA